MFGTFANEGLQEIGAAERASKRGEWCAGGRCGSAAVLAVLGGGVCLGHVVVELQTKARRHTHRHSQRASNHKGSEDAGRMHRAGRRQRAVAASALLLLTDIGVILVSLHIFSFNQ